MDRELKELMERARNHNMSPAEFEAQRLSFAYGNAPEGDTNTKESVREAVENSRVVASAA